MNGKCFDDLIVLDDLVGKHLLIHEHSSICHVPYTYNSSEHGEVSGSFMAWEPVIQISHLTWLEWMSLAYAGSWFLLFCPLHVFFFPKLLTLNWGELVKCVCCATLWLWQWPLKKSQQTNEGERDAGLLPSVMQSWVTETGGPFSFWCFLEFKAQKMRLLLRPLHNDLNSHSINSFTKKYSSLVRLSVTIWLWDRIVYHAIWGLCFKGWSRTECKTRTSTITYILFIDYVAK